MAEVVGLALAVPGVVTPMLYLIAGISGIVDDSKNIGRDMRKLHLEFVDERHKVQSSMSFLFGIPAASDGGIFANLPTNTQHLVLSIVIQLFNRIRDYTTIEATYPVAVLDSNAPSFDLEAFLRDNANIPVDPRASNLHATSNWWKKLLWSTSGKSGFEALVADLSGWNKRLRRVIQDVIWTGQWTVAQILSVEQNPAAKALGFGHGAQMRRLIIGDGPREDLLLPPHRVKNIAKGGKSILTAQVDNTQVLLEYKTYQLDDNGNIPETTEKQVRQLTSLLQCQEYPGFRVLSCKGYFNDRAESRFGLIFNVPAGAPPTPITLYSALNLKVSRSKKPSVTARLKLAHQVAESLYLLHTVGWVHKSLRSESIVFFESGEGITAYDAPWIMGFEYSRVESDFSSRRTEARIEVNMYRHWERWGQPTVRSAKIHDIYALGVILLEIGLWQSAMTLLKDGLKSHSGDNLRIYVRDTLRSHAQGRLGFSMGETYEELVLRCLEGEVKAFIKGDDDKSDTQLQKEFRERVVEVLKVASECI